MNPQDLIRSIMTALDNIGSDEKPAMGEPQAEPTQDGGIEQVKVPTIAVLTPVKIDNTSSSDGSAVKGMFPAPEHAKSEEPASDCGCGGSSTPDVPDELELIKRAAGISRPPEQ